MSSVALTPREQELRQEIIRLGPWHLDLPVTVNLSTAVAAEVPAGTYGEQFGLVGFKRNARSEFGAAIDLLWGGQLAGRSFLDCACNCGGYCFWARELGASDCFGFDVRDHWINQARFLHRHRCETPHVRFDVCDLYDLPQTLAKHYGQPRRFDVTLFKGIFYHLPDPISGLKIAADLTEELIVVNTATLNDRPDGALISTVEPTDKVMSGVHGLCWFPTGPGPLRSMLQWMGFNDFYVHWWRKKSGTQPDALGRLELFAARKPGYFDPIRAKRAEVNEPLPSA